MHRLVSVFAVVTLLPAAALAEGLDIGIRASGGRLQTVGVEGEPPMQVFGNDELRAFGAELTFDAIDSIVKAEEPGLASQDATVLGRSLRVDILKAARLWDAGTQSLVPTMQQLSTGKLPAFPFFNTPTTDTTVQTNTFIASDDFHFDWVLNGATASSAAGIYVVQLQLVDVSPTSALQPSLPYWVVFNYGLSKAEHDEAIEYVQNTLVPAPAGAAAAGMGLLCASRRRRRTEH
jgi:hypothetical protein